MKRREFIALVGGVATWPLAARAQQRALPLIGILGPQPNSVPFGDAIVAGLRELGYVDLRLDDRGHQHDPRAHPN